MKIVFILGATAEKVGENKPTRFKGGEKADIKPDQAKKLLKIGAAARVGSEEAREAKERRYKTPQRLDAVDVKKKSTLAELGESLNSAPEDPDAGGQPYEADDSNADSNAVFDEFEDDEE